MEVIKAQVFDPLFHPDGSVLPARIEVFVRGIDFNNADVKKNDRGWLIAKYGPFVQFWNEIDGIGTLPDPTGDPTDEIFFAGQINVENILDEPVAPVTVSVEGSMWREVFAPYSLVKGWLDQYGVSERGRWRLAPSLYWATKGLVSFDLEFDSSLKRQADLSARASASRKPR
jgi:hypothetical protein